jgi:purine-cytosine permease-like protein
MVGSLMTAYMSIWGAQSGSRTMVCSSTSILPNQTSVMMKTQVVARYFMGYWPSKLCALLNIVIMVGYGMITCIIGGQILSAVSGGSLSIIVGIVIVALISWVVAVFGMAVFHQYER